MCVCLSVCVHVCEIENVFLKSKSFLSTTKRGKGNTLKRVNEARSVINTTAAGRHDMQKQLVHCGAHSFYFCADFFVGLYAAL